MTSKEASARHRVSELINRSLVLLTDTPQGVRATNAGTGTLLVSATGKPFVLTAAHVLPSSPAEPISIITSDGLHIPDAIEPMRIASKRIDIAVAPIRDSLREIALARALPSSVLETSTAHRITNWEQLVLAGFPMQFTEDRVNGDHVEHRFTAIIHYAREHSHDKRRISIPWKEAFIPPMPLTTPDIHESLLGTPGHRIPLRKPSWISGGPVFRVQPSSSATFSPLRNLSLVGIAVEFVNGRELAIPWWHFSAWASGLM